MHERVLGALQDIVGSEYVADADFAVYAYSRSNDPALPPRPPEYVVRPKSAEEVSAILSLANKKHLGVVPRGGGACLTGGLKPIQEGGIVLDLTRMNRILSVDEETMVVVGEAGITWAALNAVLGEKGYWTGNLGPGSGMSATIGGGLSHHSVGGGVKSAFPCLALKIGSDRIHEALDTGAQYLVSACPFCKTNLQDAASAEAATLQVVDILELLGQTAKS